MVGYLNSSGDTSNGSDRLYVTIKNSNGKTAVVAHENPDVAKTTTWGLGLGHTETVR